MSILSIQSHVVYGYVGNKAAVYPLQAMGYDVLPINTVQFSNHTGYETWQGQILSRELIKSLVDGLDSIDVLKDCQAILSGYMGSADICHEVYDVVQRVKRKNSDAIYLCDPVIGNKSCYVKPEVLDFFHNNLYADIITPNQFEAEILSGRKINKIDDAHKVAKLFHAKGIKIVVITGIDFNNNILSSYVSYSGNFLIAQQKKYDFSFSINGTGDLFSALFLGNYLRNNDPFESLKITTSSVDEVIERTFVSKKKELQVIDFL